MAVASDLQGPSTRWRDHHPRHRVFQRTGIPESVAVHRLLDLVCPIGRACPTGGSSGGLASGSSLPRVRLVWVYETHISFLRGALRRG